jgi:orotidine-5'-phosphate decarboxylase
VTVHTKKGGLRLCVGVDPSAPVLSTWHLEDTPLGLEAFAKAFISRLPDSATTVKPQAAYFERFGSAGIFTLQALCRELRERGCEVILDAKRGDIRETNAAYAEAYLAEGSPCEVDSITLSPYLGVDALLPFIEIADSMGKRLYVVVKSSNPEGASIQNWGADHGGPLWGAVCEEILQYPTCLGAVVGAGDSEFPSVLNRLESDRPYLVPGVGAQGGTLEGFSHLHDWDVAVNVSRTILHQGPDGFAAAVTQMGELLSAAT